jgi:hypothetical protein
LEDHPEALNTNWIINEQERKWVKPSQKRNLQPLPSGTLRIRLPGTIEVRSYVSGHPWRREVPNCLCGSAETISTTIRS